MMMMSKEIKRMTHMMSTCQRLRQRLRQIWVNLRLMKQWQLARKLMKKQFQKSTRKMRRTSHRRRTWLRMKTLIKKTRPPRHKKVNRVMGIRLPLNQPMCKEWLTSSWRPCRKLTQHESRNFNRGVTKRLHQPLHRKQLRHQKKSHQKMRVARSNNMAMMNKELKVNTMLMLVRRMMVRLRRTKTHPLRGDVQRQEHQGKMAQEKMNHNQMKWKWNQ